MLAAALQAEVAAYIAAHADQVDEAGRRLVARKGHHAAREVTTVAGAVPVRAPRVNDQRVDEATGERRRFHSSILPAWSPKSPRVAEVFNAGAKSELDKPCKHSSGSRMCKLFRVRRPPIESLAMNITGREPNGAA